MSSEQSQSAPLELAGHNTDSVSVENGQPIVYPQLNPTDGGLHAWKVLIAAFFFEALLWGT